jgi:hypothetical protein
MWKTYQHWVGKQRQGKLHREQSCLEDIRFPHVENYQIDGWSRGSKIEGVLELKRGDTVYKLRNLLRINDLNSHVSSRISRDDSVVTKRIRQHYPDCEQIPQRKNR